MFCVLNIEKKKLNLIEKIFRFLSNDDYIVKTVPVFKGAPFYILNVNVSESVDWDKIIENTGKCSKKLILNNCYEIPENKNIGTFKSNVLYSKVFQNTVLQILSNNKRKLHHIAVCDKNADFIDFTKQLSKYSSKLTVVTENKEKYMNICDEILENTGLCISLLTEFDNAKLKIDASKNIMSINNETDFFNISNGENIVVDEIYKKLLVEGVNEYDFYSALYELCGVFSLGDSVFENVIVNNEKKLVKDIQFA
ncbi:MAG: hypothetical protein IKW45_07550 [Clostridia bacterium]|nr:hypothetical protein [Clostridia bacterium]